ncbi:recombinase family protein [uncultured Flavonifractor sp.]|uniref:recombinase family protein n=1 Tax=uncultured Flavonifractor sp. TaxID=1193534 RepID=UPI00259224FD|nr:recombinase family protein [uncultured Flavonifractor sp.]
MGSNRKRPFGYKMEFGEVVLHPAEAETVRWIYDSYLAGASYNALVDKLQERGIPYDGDKPWNKNMAARILADRRYTGEGGFPSIIPEGQFHMVQARRQERTTPCQKSPAQKELRKLCGGSPPAWVERQVLGLLNRLIQRPELIACPVPEAKPLSEVDKLRRELDELLHCPPVDETRARRLAFRLAALQLNAIGPEEYETLRLRRLFQNRRPMMELEQELLHESVRRIAVSNGTVTVLLKNNQTLEGGNYT